SNARRALSDEPSLYSFGEFIVRIRGGEPLAQNPCAALTYAHQDSRVHIIDARVQLVICRQVKRIKELHQAPEAYSISIIPERINAMGMRLVGRCNRRALALVETEDLNIGRYILGQARAVRPFVSRPAFYVAIRITRVLF